MPEFPEFSSSIIHHPLPRPYKLLGLSLMQEKFDKHTNTQTNRQCDLLTRTSLGLGLVKMELFSADNQTDDANPDPCRRLLEDPSRWSCGAKEYSSMS
jgi:hypothetical protein